MRLAMWQNIFSLAVTLVLESWMQALEWIFIG
jgi:hypothetical protein